MSITIVGNTVVDLVFPGLTRLPEWPRHTEFTPTNLVFPPHPPIVTLGGNGANAAYVAARCGAAVVLHTRLGADSLGGLARRWLADAGCRVESGRSAATAVTVTAANRRHQRATFFYPGGDLTMPGRRAPAASHLLVCGWPHLPRARIATGLKAARRRGSFTALDVGPILGPAWTLASLREVFAALDLFLANEFEVRAITRGASLDQAVLRLRRHFPGHIVIKRGARGALWMPAGADRMQPVPVRRIKAVNTVGAGDTFNGALLALLARRIPWPAALRAACATAAGVARSGRGVLGVRLLRH